MPGNISSAPAIAGGPADWREALSFRFRLEGVGRPPKKRPCLMLDIARFGETRYAVLACGTSAETAASQGYDVQLTATEARAAGLPHPVRFAGARRRLVALDHTGIVLCAATDTPVIGRLTGSAVERMNVLRTRIHAEAGPPPPQRPTAGHGGVPLSAASQARHSRLSLSLRSKRLARIRHLCGEVLALRCVTDGAGHRDAGRLLDGSGGSYRP